MVVDLVWRTFVIYTVLLVVMRIMGKREVGQLTPSDLVVAIVIAELAAIPMEQTDKSIVRGIIPILTLMAAEIITSWFSLKSLTFRKFLSGTPSIVIAKGQILEGELRRQRYNIHDMLSQLRDKGVADMEEVEYAILEPSGRLSVFQKSHKRALKPEDMNINPPYEGLPVPLVVDGQLIETNLLKLDLSKEKLAQLVKEKGYEGFTDILFASINSRGEMYLCPKER